MIIALILNGYFRNNKRMNERYWVSIKGTDYFMLGRNLIVGRNELLYLTTHSTHFIYGYYAATRVFVIILAYIYLMYKNAVLDTNTATHTSNLWVDRRDSQ